MEISREEIIKRILEDNTVKENINKLGGSAGIREIDVISMADELSRSIFSIIEKVLNDFLNRHGMRGPNIIIPEIAIKNASKDFMDIPRKLGSITDFIKGDISIEFDFVYHGNILMSIKNIHYNKDIDSTIHDLKNYDERKTLFTFIEHFLAE